MVSHKWLRPLAMAPLLTVISIGLAAQDAPNPAPAAPAPPASQAAAPLGTVKVAEHQSRWAYPKEINVPEGTQLHIVRTGDTFWGLASHYLGNARAWPQIWELNQWVKDSHWIYPGDPILVDGSKRAIAKADAAPGAEVQEAVPGTPPSASPDLSAPEAITQLPPDRRKVGSKQRDELGFTFQDFIQLPFLAPKGSEALFREIGSLQITGNKYPERNHLMDGEVVYLNGGQDKGLKAGDRFVIIQVRTKNLWHPSDPQGRHPLGDVVQQVGVLRVTSVLPKGSVAVLERCMDAVMVGDHAAPYLEPANITSKLRTDITEPMPIKDLGTVIYARDAHGLTAQGEMVIIDKGSADGLQVGDVMVALRSRSFPVTESRNSNEGGMEKTNYVLGQLLVVKTGETSATCRILRSSEEIKIGDTVTR